MTGVVSDFLTLLVLGGHGVVPARLAATRSATSILDDAYRTWALAALPSLLMAVTGVLAWLRLHPDPLIAVEWGRDPLSTFAGRAVLVLLPALAVADGLLVVTWRRLEPLAWRLLAAFGGTALVALSLFQEILRVGHGPRTTAAALALSVLCRTAVALGAGELLAPAAASGRPVWTVPAGVFLLLYPLALPAEIRALLIAGGEITTLGAAALLFLTCRWLPSRLRRPTVAAATLLAALTFAQTTELAGTFPVWMEPLPVQ